MQSPKRVVSALLSVIVLSAGYLDYWAYSQEFYRQPKIWMDVVSGTGSAPNQYRIGVIHTAYFLARHLHLGMRHSLALLDVISGMIAVFALFLVLQRSAVYRRPGVVAQWFGAASFVVLVQFYLAWLLWYQRPETLPSAAVLSLALLLLGGKSPGAEQRGAIGMVGTVVGLLLLVVVQGYIRSDVGFALHLGILLACMTRVGHGFALPRGVQAGTSLVAMLLVLGIQYDLMKRVYPQANYGHTQVFQLFFNLKSLPGYIPFFLFMVPLGWTTVMLARRRYLAGSAEIGMFIAAVIFLGMWATVGRIKEVRIFLPFALALVPLTVELAMQRFLPAIEMSETRAGVDAMSNHLPYS
ncbi:MAG: hypothetical protein JWQ49_4908 [Edaphobacter sp.]|nr:hypothetical protein [Edaphobacter sp.]